MATSIRATNRGPAAAADNRRALLETARHLFAAHGYQVPLSAISRDAGVGQGSLYRHFPTRLDLALAVFEDNFVELEALAASDTAPGSFGRLWQRLLELTLASTAFIELVVDARHELADAGLGDRLRRMLDQPLARARACGEVDINVSVDDLGLVLRMAYGVLATETDAGAARAVLRRALELVDPALAIAGDEERT